MDNIERARQIMLNTGYLDTDTGPYVNELRTKTLEAVTAGLKWRSPGTWSDESYTRDANGYITGHAISAEERARATLQIHWELSQGHSVPIKSIDGPPWGTKYDLVKMHEYFAIDWKRIKPWLEDQINLKLMYIKIFWNRKVLGKTNPYTKAEKIS